MSNNQHLKIALINENDEIIGFHDKINTHQKGLLHRAFSIFIFNDNNELLMQKRALSKYHSSGLWSNTCCSHLVETVDFEKYMHYRLLHEMGFDCDIDFKFSFHYKIKFDNDLTENEIDHVYTGNWNGTPSPNPNEVCDYKWMNINNIKNDIALNPDNYTHWFKVVIENIDKLITK
jgi:isopentenyl-diphosphate delta-isomerase